MPYIQTTSRSLYYERNGAGRRLLFLSGTGGDLRVRFNILSGPLPRHFDVVTYDQRSQGRSDTPPGPYSMGDFAEDAIAVMDALGWSSCSVMGMSFGGMVAQELACRYPSRIERLVLGAAAAGGAGGHSYPLHELIALEQRARARALALAADIRRTEEWVEKNPERLNRAIVDLTMLNLVGAGMASWEGSIRDQLDARQKHDTFDRLSRLKMPVLVVGGKYDGITPADRLVLLCREIPHARLELFEGGHFFLGEDPRAIATVIEFLAS